MSDAPVQTLKGFRDFLPVEKMRRDQAIENIKSTFRTFGFLPVETPTLEYASLLLGKYGTEADKLVYTFHDRGDREIGLRYDQTVPTARLLTQYRHELPKYFRRYQIQNVFRADKPQKGRYREFLQCDCDIFGSGDSLADVEILSVFYRLYANLGLKDIQIVVNDRATLMQTLAPFASESVSVFSLIQSIDKLDKHTVEEVCTELQHKGMSENDARSALAAISNAQPSENLKKIMELLQHAKVPSTSLVFRSTLARGLDYYTGLIFEAVIPGISGGSLGGGGRYDNLIGDLGGTPVPAVGFAVGFDRTVQLMEEQNLFEEQSYGIKVLVTIFDETCIPASLNAASHLRLQRIATELYPHNGDSVGKQLKYADQNNMPFAIIIGPDELKEGLITIKNLQTGEMRKCTIDQCIIHSTDEVDTQK